MNQIFKSRWTNRSPFSSVPWSYWQCWEACQNRVDKDDEEKPANGRSPATSPPARISFENGLAILTLDQQTQSRMESNFETLSAAVTRRQVARPP